MTDYRPCCYCGEPFDACNARGLGYLGQNPITAESVAVLGCCASCDRLGVTAHDEPYRGL